MVLKMENEHGEKILYRIYDPIKENGIWQIKMNAFLKLLYIVNVGLFHHVVAERYQNNARDLGSHLTIYGRLRGRRQRCKPYCNAG